MAKLKGKKALVRTVNQFTKRQFGVTAVFGLEFEALPTDKIIQFSVIVDADMQQCCIDDMEARFPDIQASMFVWLLMHEIGHCMTDDYWDDDDEKYFLKAKGRLEDYFADDVMAKNEWYHVIGDEYCATRWAGRWMRDNPHKMKKFNAKLNRAVEKFFKANGLTE